MDKRWYPVAFSMVLTGCGGDVDKSGSTATGGSAAVDAGVPIETGGMMPAPAYGVIIDPIGGSAAMGGAGTTTGAGGTNGGRTSIDTGAPSATGGAGITIYGVIGVFSSRSWAKRFTF